MQKFLPFIETYDKIVISLKSEGDKVNRKDKSKICIMIVPHTEKVTKLLIPHWLPKTTLGISSLLIVLLITYIGKNTAYSLNLNHKLKESMATIENLENENQEKNLELASLKSQNNSLHNKSIEVEMKLMEIDELQKILEEMAGIDSPSKGGGAEYALEFEDINPELDMGILADVLEDKKLEMENFIYDLKDRFENLEYIPDSTPTSGRLTSKFGNRKNPFGRGIQFHQGIDLANSKGTDIFAAGKGTVVFAGTNGGYGRVIIIDHGNGYKTLYAHNNKLLVSVGNTIEKGQLISKMGRTGRSTGNHLHFEIRENDNPINPFNVLKD